MPFALCFLRGLVVTVSPLPLLFVGLWAVVGLLLWVRLLQGRGRLLRGHVVSSMLGFVSVSFVPGGVVVFSPVSIPVAARLLVGLRSLGLPCAAVSFPASCGGGVSVFAAPWLGALLCSRAFRSSCVVGLGVVWAVR